METPPKKITEEETDTEMTEKQIKEAAKKSALEKLKQAATIVNVEELAENEARKAADANMAESYGSNKIGFFKKMWKHTFFDEYYRQKEVNKVREDIKNTGDIYVGRLENTNTAAHENTMQAISDRFTSEYEGTLSDGEEKKMLDDKDPETIKLRGDLKNLLDNYAMGKIDVEAFKKEKDILIKGVESDELLKGVNNYTDNLLEIAQNARLAIEHGAKMEELDYNLNIVVGKAKSSLKTEAHFNWVDQGIDKMKKSKVGRFISPAVLSTAIGLGYSISVGASKKLMSSKAAMWVSLGGSVAISSIFAGMNESQRVALERKQRDIEAAEGGRTEKGDKRREQLDRYQYQMESSSNLSQNLRDLMFETDEEGNEVVKDIKEEDIEKIMASLSEIDARKSLNTRKKIDLISYSGIGNVEKESTDLTILVAKAKVELNKKLQSGLSGGLPEGKDFDTYLAEQTQAIEDTLLGGEKGISAQDRAFRKYKAGRIAKKMAATAVGGLIIGGTLQEFLAFFKDDVQGFAEGIFRQDANATIQTPFESLHNWISGSPSHMGMEGAVTESFNGHELTIPAGVSLLHNTDGTIDLLRGENVISSHFLPTFDANGNLDAASIAKLGQDGVMVSATHQIIESTKEVTSNASDWLNNHEGETTNIHRDFWYGNDTPMNVDPETGVLLGADLNETSTIWGGINGTGINENGDAVLNIAHMTPEGSFHEGFSIDAQEAMSKGNLMAIITLDGANQGQVIPVPVGADGNIIFDHNNPIMQQIFKPDANGQMVSHAKFIEIVQRLGLDKNGIEHVRPLSTLVGEGLSQIKDNIPSYLDITTNSLSPTLGTEMPLFIPLVARRPLGKVVYEKENPNKKAEKQKEKGIDVIPVIKKEEEGDTNPENDKREEGIDVIPVPVDKIEKQKTLNEISIEEYDAMYDDLKMINRKIQTSNGIITVSEGDFKSAYGKKRYMDLKSIQDGIPVRFNKYELQTIGDEIEGLLSKSKVISKEEMAKRLEQENKAKSMESDMKHDLEMLNKNIRESKGIITLSESDFKSEFGKEQYKKLKSIPDGKNITFNKDELQKIGDEMEKNLINHQKKIKSEKESNITFNQYGEIIREDKEEKDTETNKKSFSYNNEVIIGEKEAKKETVIFDQYGKEINSKKEKVEEKSDEEKISDIKKEVEKGFESKEQNKEVTPESKEKSSKEKEFELKNPNDIKEVTPENKSNSNENIFDIKDLSKMGTKFESEDNSFEVSKITKSGGFFGFFGKTEIQVIIKNKKTGVESVDTADKKYFENLLKINKIKITETREKK